VPVPTCLVGAASKTVERGLVPPREEVAVRCFGTRLPEQRRVKRVVTPADTDGDDGARLDSPIQAASRSATTAKSPLTPPGSQGLSTAIGVEHVVLCSGQRLRPALTRSRPEAAPRVQRWQFV
jgi:hypothetical protein